MSLLWARRNKLRVGERVASLVQINALAADTLQEYQRALATPQSIPKAMITPRWSPPPAGWVKVNFDGETVKEMNLAGLGGVI